MRGKTIWVLFLACGFATTTYSQDIKEYRDETGNWEIRTTFFKKEWPQWLTGSRYDTDVYTTVNHKGEIFVVLAEHLAGVGGYVDGKVFVVSPQGNVLAQKSNILPWDSLYAIHSVTADPDGNFWVSTKQTVNNDLRENFLYCFSPALYEMTCANMPLADLFFHNGKMLLGVNAGTVVLGDSIRYEKNAPFTLLTLDYHTLRIVAKQALPATGTGVKSYFIPNTDGSFYYVLNTTVLEGPDHHDVHLYRFSPEGRLLQHRFLKGESELTHLYVQAATHSVKEDLQISGYSDSPVDFAKTGKYMSDTIGEFILYDPNGNESVIHLPLRKAMQAKDSLGTDYNTVIHLNPFNFTCIYSHKLELSSYHFTEYRNMYTDNTGGPHGLPEFETPALKKYGNIKYRVIPGADNSNEQPVFILYKDQ